jgi:hypothetical protein
LHDKFGLRAEKILFWEGSMKQNSDFPETVEHKSCTATIYRQKNRNALRYEVRYYDVDGSMQRVTFPTNTSAKKFAEAAVRELAANREYFVTLRGRDAFDYQTATETLSPLGLSIAQAATLIVENHRQLDGQGTLPEAIKYFLENRPQRSPDITVREVVDQLLALKEKEGEVGAIYLRDLRLRLHKFAKAFQCPISRVSITLLSVDTHFRAAIMPACNGTKSYGGGAWVSLLNFLNRWSRSLGVANAAQGPRYMCKVCISP